MFAWKRKKASAVPPTVPPGARQVEAATLLRAIPHLHPHVERIGDRRYGCLLTWTIAQPAARRRTWLGRLFAPPARRRRLVLDDLGRRTVELIDGRRSLAEIAERLVQQTGHKRDDMEPAVLAFVGQLVRRNAAALIAPQD